MLVCFHLLNPESTVIDSVELDFNQEQITADDVRQLKASAIANHEHPGGFVAKAILHGIYPSK